MSVLESVVEYLKIHSGGSASISQAPALSNQMFFKESFDLVPVCFLIYHWQKLRLLRTETQNAPARVIQWSYISLSEICLICSDSSVSNPERDMNAYL